MTATEAQRWRLFLERPDGAIDRHEAASSTMTLGRGADCDVHLDGESVSPLHARIELKEGAFALTDSSAAGTRIGGRQVRGETARLAPTELIQIGDFRVRLQLVAGLREPNQTASGRTDDVAVSVRRRIHREVLDHLDLVKLERSRMNDHLLRAKVTHALGGIVARYRDEMPAGVDVARLIEEVTHEAIGLGPLDGLLADPLVTEIMVIDAQTIYVERARGIVLTDLRFTDEESVRAVLERIVAPLGRRIDESSPMLDARLPDGSRVNAVVKPLALRGTCITIRKFSGAPLGIHDLQSFGSLTARMARFLERAVAAKKNILISGGTGSGKTTLLNILSGAVHRNERIVTIEDAAELRLPQPHVVSLESRPPNMEGRGEISIRDLVRNAMRMRPDRLIIGECRGAEALDMLQAMNTGHAGSMTTTHANSPAEAIKRIETLALMAGLDVPARALREQIAMSLHLIVQQSHLPDGSRKIVSIAEVVGLADDGQVDTREIFGFRRTGMDAEGRVRGDFYATGYLPSFLGDFLTHGLVGEDEDAL